MASNVFYKASVEKDLKKLDKPTAAKLLQKLEAVLSEKPNTGEPLSGKEAAEIELINKAVPFPELEHEVRRCAERLAQLPPSQVAAMKLIVNQAYENMGLHHTQQLGPILDGYMRNTPEALAFVKKAATEGVAKAIADRDGPFADYSQGPPSRQPKRDHVIRPRGV